MVRGTPTSASRPRVSSCNGPLTITTITSLTLSPPGRTRPKKEDWLKKKDRKQRRPGCRRKKTRKRGRAPAQGPSLSPETVLCPRDCHKSHRPADRHFDANADIQTSPAAAKQLIGREGLRTFLGLRVVFLRVLRFPPNLSFKTTHRT